MIFDFADFVAVTETARPGVASRLDSAPQLLRRFRRVVGIWLVSACAWPGPLTVLSPVAMTYFLVFATGARLLERHMAHRPGFAAYQARTSYFLPRRPRRT